MAAVSIRPPRDDRCRAYREHLRDRVDKRQFLAPMALELDEWLKRAPCGFELLRRKVEDLF